MDELRKNQEYTAQITGFTSEGMGVCRINGRAVFVSGAIAGETIRVRIVKVTKTAAWGRIQEIITASEHRVTPECPYFGKCGGCDLWHMDYAEELDFKLNRVNDALHRIGGLDFSVDGILGADSVLSYRNKAIYAVGNGPVTGFFRERSHDVIPVSRCLIQSETADRAAAAVTEWMKKFNIPAYDEREHSGLIRHVFTRTARTTGMAQTTVVSFGEVSKKASAALVDTLCAVCPELCSIVLCINKTAGNTVLGGDFKTLWGNDYLEDKLCGLSFRLSPLSFYQVNPVQAERLYNKALEYAAPDGCGTVLDLYCGAGTISLCLARGAQKVIGAEINEAAVNNARENAENNGITNAEFICADAGGAAQELARRGIRPDAIVVDPPRKGLSQNVIDAIGVMQPERVVYVSCDPGTLARDIKIFAEHGYMPKTGMAVDMFARTRHVETVVQLVRKKPDTVLDVKIDLSELDVTPAETEATYREIKDYIFEQHGVKVSSLYIAQVKEKHGIKERECYNKPKSENPKQLHCPAEKEKLIEEALKHFKMI